MFASGPGQTYSASVFVDPLIEDLKLSRTLVSGMYTAGSLTAAAAMVVVGRLLDRYGARTMLIWVTIAFGVAVMGMSTVHHPAHLYAGFASIRILGQGSLSLIPTTLASIWFVRFRGRATALMGLGSAASLAVYPPLIHLLISNYDWRQAWVILGFMVWGVLLIPAGLLVRRSPESIGLLPDGGTTSQSRPTQSASSRPAQDTDWTLREALHTRAFWLILFSGSAHSLISTAFIFHHVSLMGSRGLDAGMAAAVLSVLAPVALVGVLCSGFLADAVPNRYLIVANQVVLAAAMVITLFISQAWHAFAYITVLAISNGLHMPVASVIWANYFGRSHLGTIRGVAHVGAIAFSAMGPLPFGFLFDLTDAYTMPVLIFLALPAVSAVAALMALPPQRRAMPQ